jgi:hypothetical protein
MDGDALIIGADGEVATVPTVSLTDEEARLLRAYRRFLEYRHLREALYCDRCFEGNLSDGCAAAVTEHEIVIKCRCKVRTFLGPTY